MGTCAHALSRPKRHEGVQQVISRRVSPRDLASQISDRDSEMALQQSVAIRITPAGFWDAPSAADCSKNKSRLPDAPRARARRAINPRAVPCQLQGFFSSRIGLYAATDELMVASGSKVCWPAFRSFLSMLLPPVFMPGSLRSLRRMEPRSVRTISSYPPLH